MKLINHVQPVICKSFDYDITVVYIYANDPDLAYVFGLSDEDIGISILLFQTDTFEKSYDVLISESS